VLEYYSGILILTTNRVGEFDEAATSRIHCALYYPPFDEERALEVWQKNIERLERANENSKFPIKLNPNKIRKFAAQQWEAGNRWNGRQIKNAFQTAVALADWDNLKKSQGVPSTPNLRIKHFKAVVETSNHFESYLTSVRKSAQERAKMNQLRRDNVDYNPPDSNSPDQISKKASQPKWPGVEDSDDDESDDSDSESDERSKKKKAKKSKGKKKTEEKARAKKKSKSKQAPESSESSESSSSADSE
jgi:hypothetical protein